MDKETFHIDIPDFNEINIEIEKIVEKGVKPKKSFFKYLKDIYKNIGFRYLFHDINELIVLTVIMICVFTFVGSVIGSNAIKEENLYKFIFLVSPLIYLLTSLFAFFNTIEKGTFQVEMTCKYNLYELAAIRMFVFSIISILVNSISIIWIFIINGQINVIRALVISITSVFLFSTIFLYMITKISSTVTKYIVIFSWIIVNLVLGYCFDKFITMVLLSVPIYIHLIISAICIYFYIKNLNKFICLRKVRGEL